MNTFVPIDEDGEVDDDDDDDDINRDAAFGYQAGGGVELWIPNNVSVSADTCSPRSTTATTV